MTELCELSAVELLSLYAARKLSPVEVIRDVIARSEAVQPVLNAFCSLDPERALATAVAAERSWMAGLPTRALEGVPVSVKDTAMVKGWRFARGSRLAEHNPPVTQDSPSVGRLRGAGAVLFASTTTCEGGWKAVTDSPLTGITRNPHNTDHTPGGSSGGAGASISAGCGPLALGSDGGGSIRVPASFSGIFGFKATFGRVPMYPIGPHYSDMAHFGPMTRTVADAGLMFSVIEGRHPMDPFTTDPLPASDFPLTPLPLAGVRIGVTEDFGFMKVDPEVAAVYRAAIARIEDAGAVLVPLAPMEDWRPTYRTLWQVGAWQSQRRLSPAERDLLDPEFRGWGDHGAHIPTGDYVDAMMARLAYRQECARQHATVDFVISPTVSILPLRAGLTVPDDSWPDWLEWAGFSLLYNMTGQPASSLPAGYSSCGLPVGIQIGGRINDDIGVLRLSMTLEALLAEARPDPSAVFDRAMRKG